MSALNDLSCELDRRISVLKSTAYLNHRASTATIEDPAAFAKFVKTLRGRQSELRKAQGLYDKAAEAGTHKDLFMSRLESTFLPSSAMASLRIMEELASELPPPSPHCIEVADRIVGEYPPSAVASAALSLFTAVISPSSPEIQEYTAYINDPKGGKPSSQTANPEYLNCVVEVCLELSMRVARALPRLYIHAVAGDESKPPPLPRKEPASRPPYRITDVHELPITTGLPIPDIVRLGILKSLTAKPNPSSPSVLLSIVKSIKEAVKLAPEMSEDERRERFKADLLMWRAIKGTVDPSAKRVSFLER